MSVGPNLRVDYNTVDKNWKHSTACISSFIHRSTPARPVDPRRAMGINTNRQHALDVAREETNKDAQDALPG
jgi:hypothetical protein